MQAAAAAAAAAAAKGEGGSNAGCEVAWKKRVIMVPCAAAGHPKLPLAVLFEGLRRS
jgi:hypothetical protein